MLNCYNDRTKKYAVISMLLISICGVQLIFISTVTASAAAGILLKLNENNVIEPTTTTALVLHPFSYHEDFEKKDPFKKWTSNGEYTVNYKGLSSERSTSGKKSFKIDITFETATYIYFKIPVRVPSVGNLNLKGNIYVSETSGASAAIGTNIDLYPSKHSGVNFIHKIKKISKDWEMQTSDIVKVGEATADYVINKYLPIGSRSDTGIWVDRLGLFLHGKKNDRIVLYIDDLILEGNVPISEEYKQANNIAWEKYQSKVKTQISNFVKQIGTYNKADVDEILNSITKSEYVSIDNYLKLKQIAEDADYISDGGELNDDIIIFPFDPTSDRKILPDTFPIPSQADRDIKITACPGEYEPASFILRAQKDIYNINISTSDFNNLDGDIIPANAIDIKYVKCWYQAGEKDIYVEKGKKYLTPELLLKDDSLIKVDYKTKTNYLKVSIDKIKQYIDITDPDATFPPNATIQDAIDLQPINLKKQTNKQIWITVLIPENTKPGNYTGNIVITGDNIPPLDLVMHMEVLGFKLSKPPLEYSIYYRGNLESRREKTKIPGSWYKSSKQYEKELINMKQHGISSPTVYQSLDQNAEKCLTIREQLGFKLDKLYMLGIQAGNYIEANNINRLTADVTKWIKIGNKFNVKKIYIYGIDEGSIDVIKSQKKVWEAAHNLGAGIFVTCPKHAFDTAPGLLDVAVISRVLDPEVALKWHSNKSKVYSYANPQVGVENPEIYRTNYGFDLWLNDYDGTMNYAYQHGMNGIWNDFDHEKYRDHVFAYPTSDGVIDTIQWEGFREGVDDLRYLNILAEKKSIDKIKSDILNLMKKENSSSEIRKNIIYQIKKNKLHFQ